MIHSRRDKICAVAAVLSVGVGLAGACTPATPDDALPAAGSGPTTSGGAAGSPTATAGAGNPVGAGGSEPAGAGSGAAQAGAMAAAGASTAGAGGAMATGGAPSASAGAAGSAGAMAGGGTVGAAGATSAGKGCNWVTTAGKLAMNPAAADKVVLFDGKNLSQWHRLNQPTTAAQWQVLPDGSMEVVPQPTPTNIQSNAKFDDVCLHVEYKTPMYPSSATVQQQGNSGIYLKSAYEMQVLDTSQLGPIYDGCGAVYKVSPPLVVACTQYGTWNTYEIEFKGSVWDTSTPPKKTQNAVFVQVALNGRLVQQNVTLSPPAGFTEAGIPDVAGPQPIALQDHRDYVDFRNIWVTIPHN